MASVDPLESLHLGFRRRYLDYDTLTQQLRGWAERFPELVRLRSLGQTPQGRELWQVTLGREPERIRPAVWIDGNMHASELCGSSVALSIAERVLRLLLMPESCALPRPLRETLSDVVFHVLPRMSPDGAEAVLQTGRWVRSVPRDPRQSGGPARWVASDLDGDGRALLMRVVDPTGEWSSHPSNPSVLVPRRLEDDGPFYKLYPEGLIEDFDGRSVPDAHFLSDNWPDLNRNFPWSWAPEPAQTGAGDYPGSEVESRAVIEATTALPNLFFWLNFHSFGGVFIRPLGDAPDKQLPDFDRAVFREIGEWCTELTGYPMVSGFEEFTYEEDKALRGDLSDYAYHQRGCIAYVCELWDLFKRLGIPRPRRFCDYYTAMGRDELLALAEWDAAHNGARVFPGWTPFEHPQLGRVEIGGYDPRIGVWNPPEEELEGMCRVQADAALRVAALAPRPVLELHASRLSSGLHRVRATVENHGYLPTYVLEAGRQLGIGAPLRAEIVVGSGLQLYGAPRVELGHLDGWGRGVGSRDMVFHVPRSRGSTARASAEWTVSGSGIVEVKVHSPRLGEYTKRVELGPE
ncbi:MAG: M14 family metallopeptidase [Polyangiaceae bacterium]